jgi:hypothetical protein
MRQLEYKFLRENYSYNNLVDYMVENVYYTKRSYKIFEILRPYLDNEMKTRMDYPETERLDVNECITLLRQQFMCYKMDSSYRFYLLKTSREMWEHDRNSGQIGRVMLRLSKLIY